MFRAIRFTCRMPHASAACFIQFNGEWVLCVSERSNNGYDDNNNYDDWHQLNVLKESHRRRCHSTHDGVCRVFDENTKRKKKKLIDTRHWHMLAAGLVFAAKRQTFNVQRSLTGWVIRSCSCCCFSFALAGVAFFLSRFFLFVLIKNK